MLDLISASSRLMASNSFMADATPNAPASSSIPCSCPPPTGVSESVEASTPSSGPLVLTALGVLLLGLWREPRTDPLLPIDAPGESGVRLEDVDGGVHSRPFAFFGFGVVNAPMLRKTRPPLAPTSIARYSSASCSRSESSYSISVSSTLCSNPGVDRGEGPAIPPDDAARSGGSISSSSIVCA